MNLMGNAVAVVYFIFPMSFAILLLLYMPFGFLTDVSTIRTSGFAGPNTAASIIGTCGLIIGLSLLIPPLRKIYRALPWVYHFIKIFYADLIILNIGLAILNYGYQVISEARHTFFFALMIVQIALCRLAMCYYFKIRPVKRIEAR
jgi:hypothetical protein